MERPGTEEVIVPYPTQRNAVSFRSTWLSSSLRALRERSLTEQYLRHLPERYHEAVLHPVAGVWLPVDVAVAHYAAMDSLGLSDAEVQRIGGEVTERFHSNFFSTVFRLAQTAGATPWSILGQAGRMWDRTWIGGGPAVFRVGPNDARGELVGWPCAKYRYCRVGMQGVLLGQVSLFCRRATVTLVEDRCTDTSLMYRMTWV